jgi:integrase
MPLYKRKRTNYPGVYFIEGTSVATGKPELIYYIMYRRDGKLIEEKAGRQYQDDMTPAKASRMRSLRINGSEMPNIEQRKAKEEQKLTEQNRWTLNRIFVEFVNHKSHLKSLRDDVSRYKNHIEKTYGDKEPAELSRFDFDRIRINLSKTHQPATVKQVLVLLKRIINFGVNMGLCKPTEFKIEMPKVNNLKTEDLSPTQLRRLLEVLNENSDKQASNIMKLALFTGMRRSELFNLQWEHIDFDKGFIKIQNPKGGKDQIIPLNDSTLQVLNDHPRYKSPYIFPGRTGGRRDNITKAMNKIKERAGLPKDFRPLHGLRHTFASMLASSGQVDMYTLQKLLTHKSPMMTQRYAHLRDETLKRASNLAGELISQTMNIINEEKESKLG